MALSHCWHVYVHNKYATTKHATPIWVNYNISLTWIKAIWGWFPLLTMIPGLGRSEVVIIYPDPMFHPKNPSFLVGRHAWTFMSKLANSFAASRTVRLSPAHMLQWMGKTSPEAHGFYHQIQWFFRLKCSHHPILWIFFELVRLIYGGVRKFMCS